MLVHQVYRLLKHQIHKVDVGCIHSQGICKEHVEKMHTRKQAGNMQGTYREHAGNLQGTCRENEGNMKGT
jgi:hypothetical protein